MPWLPVGETSCCGSGLPDYSWQIAPLSVARRELGRRLPTPHSTAAYLCSVRASADLCKQVDGGFDHADFDILYIEAAQHHFPGVTSVLGSRHYCSKPPFSLSGHGTSTELLYQASPTRLRHCHTAGQGVPLAVYPQFVHSTHLCSHHGFSCRL